MEIYVLTLNMKNRFDVNYNTYRWIAIITVAVTSGFAAKRLFGFGTLGLIIGSGIGATLVHFYLYNKYSNKSQIKSLNKKQ